MRHWLGRSATPTPGVLDRNDTIPVELLKVFQTAGSTLSDFAAIHTGTSPRANFYRRLAPPAPGWKGILQSARLRRFSPGKPEQFLSWNRFHLFRLPELEEYGVKEKVILSRVGPPLTAAVDRSGSPIGMSVYSLVPTGPYPASALACVLNSRLADFYFNRLATPGKGGRLRLDAIRRFPLPQPRPESANQLGRIGTLLAHFGEQPESAVDRLRRSELLTGLEEEVFALYGLGPAGRKELASMHF
jgi:hypothetical protein